MVTKEIRNMFRQYAEIQEKATFFKNETERLTEKLVNYESMIAEMRGSVKQFHKRNQFTAQQIKVIDEDEIVCGANRPKMEKTRSKTRRQKSKEATLQPKLTGLVDMKFGMRKDESLLNFMSNSQYNENLWASKSSFQDGTHVECGCITKNFAKMQNKFYERLTRY